LNCGSFAGLEFRDVLLFNFFKDSPAKNEWRVVLEQVRKRGKPTTDYPQFDRVRMNILASELKELYTAVTRPQQRLWIVDEDMYTGDGDTDKHPMLQYWEAGGCSDSFTLVNSAEEYSAGASFASMAHRSTPEEWARQGKYLFEHKHYSQAEHCYSRAGVQFKRQQDISHAFMLRGEAARFSNREERVAARSKYGEAAESFKALEMWDRASECYEKGGMHREAGDLLKQRGQFEKAAEQYLKCTAFSDQYSRRDASLDACACLELAGQWMGALRVLQEAKLWREAIALLAANGDKIERAAMTRVAKLAYLHFEHKVDCQGYADDALRLHATDAERERFLITHKSYDRLIVLYRATEQHEKAANLLEKDGAWAEAAQHYRRAGLSKAAGENTVRAVSSGMRWDVNGQATLVDVTAGEAHTLLDKAIADCTGQRDELQVLARKCQALKAMLVGNSTGLAECAGFFSERFSRCNLSSPRMVDAAADLFAWDLRCLDAIFANPTHGLRVATATPLLCRLADISHKMLAALPYRDKRIGMWYTAQLACKKFFSFLSSNSADQITTSRSQGAAAAADSAAANVLVLHDAWGDLMLRGLTSDTLDPPRWAPNRVPAEAHPARQRVWSVAVVDARRAVARYLLSTACRLLLTHLNSPATFDGIKMLMPCPALNTHRDCRERASGRCKCLHEFATEEALRRHLDALLLQCSAVSILLVIRRAQDRRALDRLSDGAQKQIMPLRRRWFEKLVRGIQPISQRFESVAAVFGTVSTTPQELCYGLVELVQEVWLQESTFSGDVGAFLRSTLLLAKISTNLQTLPIKTLQDKCHTFALGGHGQNANHFSLFRRNVVVPATQSSVDPSSASTIPTAAAWTGPPLPTLRLAPSNSNAPVMPALSAPLSIHTRCLLFWNHLEHGEAAGALEEGIAYLGFAAKCLKDSSIAYQINPNPVDLVEFIELLVTMVALAGVGCHNVILPRSYLIPILRKRDICLSANGLARSYRAFFMLKQQLPVLETHIFSFLQSMVCGRLYSAMRPEQQKRHASFDDWRALCSRAALSLIFLSVNQDTTSPLRLNSVIGKICSLETMERDPVMGGFRFPRADRDDFFSRSPPELLQRMERWYAASVDKLALVQRADFKATGGPAWQPGFTQLVVFDMERQLLQFPKREAWMGAHAWLQAGSTEWALAKKNQVRHLFH
jgi:tetratricopeptide (TPR) repeat protein